MNAPVLVLVAMAAEDEALVERLEAPRRRGDAGVPLAEGRPAG